MSQIDSVGVIGIGHIGKGFVDRLSSSGCSIVGYDIAETQIEYVVEQGGSCADSPAAVVEQTNFIVLALPGSSEVEATMDGEEGILSALEENQVVIDVTTTRAKTSRTYAEKCAEVGASFIEAPITGGSPLEGMHMMIGGSKEDYEAARPVLDILCDDHTQIGEIGAATIFKFAIQMRYAGHEAVDAEIVEFLRDSEVDPAPLRDFLEFDLSEKYLTRDFSQDIEGLGGLAIWHKDIGYAREAACNTNTALPLNGVIHEAYKAAMTRNNDSGEEGHAAQLITYWEQLNDAENR